MAILNIQEEIKRDRARERELRERRKEVQGISISDLTTRIEEIDLAALKKIPNTKCIVSSEEAGGQQIR